MSEQGWGTGRQPAGFAISQLTDLRASGHAAEWSGRGEGSLEKVPMSQIKKLKIPGQQDGDSHGEFRHFRDQHENDVAKCFHAWALTEAQTDMAIIMLKRGLRADRMHQQMAASMEMNSELLWVWLNLQPPMTESMLSEILRQGCQQFEMVYNIKVFDHESHDLAARVTIMRDIKDCTTRILLDHMKDFVATATPEEMAMAAIDDDTDEEALGRCEELQSNSSADEYSQ